MNTSHTWGQRHGDKLGEKRARRSPIDPGTYMTGRGAAEKERRKRSKTKRHSKPTTWMLRKHGSVSRERKQKYKAGGGV